MKIISSELYVKDNKVYHEGNKPKPKDIGAAPETHTHNYASATTPGGSAEHAIKATEDSLGQRIDKYIKGLSVSGRTITYTRGDGTTGTITTQDNNTDTKVTNTLNTTAKAYITGTTESATNTGTQVFDTNVYLDTTAGMLTATTFKGALQGNAATATSATSATSATKLATARTINGTSFDGTGNITTANWGTARNIQIGNSSKSVNGSSNMTWTLAEIGAAPDGHTHNYAPTSHNHGLLHDNFGVTIANTTTDNGWSMINGSYNGFLLKSLRSSANAPAWLQNDYAAGIAFGGADTKGVMSVAYSNPSVKFAGGNGSKPVWYFTVKGSSGKTYNMDSLAANTANTLATPRTINGTNFNGSANITTANWGTARTLTIGNTGKSVNGSGNVSWSIGEIGAAPASHNHTSLTGITNLSFAAEGSDSASITTTVDGANTYFDFNLSDDPSQNDMWRWRFRPSGANVFNAMTLDAISTTEAKLAVTGEVQATRLKGTLTGDVKGNVTGTVSGNAGSATKLATPRTINGTNFDGTANITTANWGTARNIQIGNAVKSVNGSGNVTWSLSEIGAAPIANGVQRWNSVIKCATWSRIMYLSGHTTVGHSGIINIQGTRTSVVFNATFIINTSHSSKAYITQINNTNYSNFQIRAVTNSGGDTYVEVYDNANGATNATTQTLNVSYTAISGVGAGTLTKYTAFTDGTTIPTNFAEVHKITTVSGSHYSGNAATATKLQTARTINGTNFDGTSNITTANWGTARNIQIGNTSKSVNGSANVSWSLAEIGAAAASHTHNYAGSSSAGGAANSANLLNIAGGRAASANSAVIVGPNTSMMLSTSSMTTGKPASDGYITEYRWDNNGGWSAQLFVPNNTTGVMQYRSMNAGTWGNWNTIYSTCNPQTTITGNAGTATKLQTARTINGTSFDGTANITTANWGTARNIQIGNTAKSVNGSANVTWSLSEIGAAASNHTHNNITSRGRVTCETGVAGRPAVTGLSMSEAYNNGYPTTYGNVINLRGGGDGQILVGWSGTDGAHAPVYVRSKRDNTNTANWSGWAQFYTTANPQTTITGNAGTATKLQTARTISLGGILSGSASFDGSGNVTINAKANDITTITKSLKVTTSWMDTGITGTNLATGTYAVQMLVNDGTNTSQYNEYYSGVMSWYADATNSTDADEILFHKAGHASNGRHVYLRTIRTGNSGRLKLQISCTHAFSAASSITFKFKKLI